MSMNDNRDHPDHVRSIWRMWRSPQSGFFSLEDITLQALELNMQLHGLHYLLRTGCVNVTLGIRGQGTLVGPTRWKRL